MPYRFRLFLLAGMIVVGTMPGTPAAHGENAAFKAGDHVTTTAQTPVKGAEGAIASLEADAELTVVNVKQGWVGIVAEQNGKKIVGWVKPDTLKPAAANPAVEAFERGYAHHLKGEFDQAVAEYTEAIRLNPKYAQAYNNRGLAHQSQHNLSQAIADFTEAVQLTPTLTAAYVNRGIAHAARRDFSKAIADYDEALRFDPDSYQAYKRRAMAYDAKGEREKAAADHARASKYYKPKYDTVAHKAIQIELEAKGKDFTPNYELLDSIIDVAKANIKMGDHSEENAIAAMQIIDAILASKKFVFISQGLMCDALVQHPLTKELLQRANPKDFRFRPQAGDNVYLAHPLPICLLYASIGEAMGLPIHVAMAPGLPYVRWDIDGSSHVNWDVTIGAVKTDQELMARQRIQENLVKSGVYLTPLSNDETLASVFSNLAKVWVGEWAGLENEYAPQPPKNNANNKDANSQQAPTAEQDAENAKEEDKEEDKNKWLARHAKAIAALDKAIALNRRAYEIYLQRGQYWSMIGQNDKTVNDYSIAIGLNPDQLDPYLARGAAYLSSGNRPQALNDFERAIQMNPQLPVAYYFRGIVRAENREFDRSVEDLSKAIRMKPKFAKAYEVRAEVYEMLGQKDKANDDLNTLKSLQQQQQQ